MRLAKQASGKRELLIGASRYVSGIVVKMGLYRKGMRDANSLKALSLTYFMF